MSRLRPPFVLVAAVLALHVPTTIGADQLSLSLDTSVVSTVTGIPWKGYSDGPAVVARFNNP